MTATIPCEFDINSSNAACGHAAPQRDIEAEADWPSGYEGFCTGVHLQQRALDTRDIRLASCYYLPKLCLRTPASWISIRLNFLGQAETDRTTPIQAA